MRNYLFGSLVLLAACRIDLPEYASDDALADAAVPDAMLSPDSEILSPAMLVTAQTPFDFGDVTVDGLSGSLQVIVRNSGEQTTSVLSATLTGDADEFDLLVAGTDDCVGVTLAAQATCVAEVRFHPGTAGAHQATLEVSATDGGMISVTLDGNALTAGDLVITAGATLPFSTIEIESTSTIQTLTVQNTGGSATAALDTILSDETNYAVVTDDCEGMMLGAGLSCDVDVRFEPTTVGSLPASISVRESPTVGVAAGATGTGTARLAVTKTGVGDVVSTPSGINCTGGAACVTTSFSQTPVQLVASQSDLNYVFDAWTGACAAELTATCSVPLTVPLTSVGVTFRQLACTPDTIVCDDGTSHYVDCDTDGDIEFEMQCPLGCASGMEKCLDVDPSNGLATYLDMAPSGPDVAFTGSSTINTDSGVVVNGGTAITVPNASASGIRVFMFNSLTIGGTVKVSGTAPLALLVDGAVTITGTLDVSADGASGGPGRQTACVGGAVTANPAGGGGGAGRAYNGSSGGSSSTPSAGGSFGVAASDPDATPLAGGCAGGLARTSINATAPKGAGGGGGGAVQIVSRVAISLTGIGVIDASGGGGRGGAASVTPFDDGPGGGGGSGGGVLLEAPLILLDGLDVTVSTKGAGGGGVGQNAHGQDGETDAAAAAGGSVAGKPIGGNGGTQTLQSTTGGIANTSPGHGAGGGGSVGEVTFNIEEGVVVPQNGATIRSRRHDGILVPRIVP